MFCEKRTFPSTRAAHDSVRTLNHTVRVYYCADCCGYHVAKRGEDTGERQLTNKRRRAATRTRKTRRGSLDHDDI